MQPEMTEPSKQKLSPELEALDSMIQLALMEKKAPAKIFDSWNSFLFTCAAWEAELEEQKKHA